MSFTRYAGVPMVISASFVSLTAVFAVQTTRTRALGLCGGFTVQSKVPVFGTALPMTIQLVPPFGESSTFTVEPAGRLCAQRMLCVVPSGQVAPVLPEVTVT